MFEGLQRKWKVSGLRLALILCTFAIGGSATGYIAKKIMNSLAISPDWIWAVVYILLITIIWPLAVLIISIPFGQFGFFSKYIRRLGARMGIGKERESQGSPRIVSPAGREQPLLKPVRLAIFASGAGSNAQKIIDYFRNHPFIHVELIVCNNPKAGVLAIAERENIPTLLLQKESFFGLESCLAELKESKIGFIVLAGFLWKLPASLVQAYRGRIVNIHPALLPRFGGKGMYGHYVHEAVIAAGEKESGITIHLVDEIYDNGAAIFKATCPVLPGDTPDSLAARIHALEHEHYPRVIGELVDKLAN
jgi:formyltetrahydrofolate-dependent phosphoribosylglycinamide formyltransferase